MRRRYNSSNRDGSGSTRGRTESQEGVRLNRYIARSGITSRRKADELIEQGRVRINGSVVTELGTRVSEGDQVEVNGRVVSPRNNIYILVNKPKDTITTTDDPRDRNTVMDLIDMPEIEKGSLFPVGRLDRDTVGVLLVTNDGELAHRLMHPRYEVDKLYLVRTARSVKPHEIAMLREGVDLEDGRAAADQVAYVDPADHHQIGIRIHEGRNRQIRRMFEALGHDIVHLERVNYAGLSVEGIRRGKWRHLHDYEVRRLRRQIRLK